MTGLGSGPSPRYASDLSQSDEFRIFHCKILPCRKRYSHDWNDCVFAHAGEKIQRRCPRKHQYMGIMCPDIKKFSVCPRGDACCYAHNSFEYWLHPSRYRTEMCTFGTACSRPVCFFAHDPSELRCPEGPAAASVSFQLPGYDPTDSMPPQAAATHFYGTPDASPRADQGAWSTSAATTSAPQLADAMAGLYLTHQGTERGTRNPRHAAPSYPDPAAYPPAAPYPEAMPYPQSNSTNTYPHLMPRSPAPYATMARSSAHLQPSLNPPATIHPTLRRPSRSPVTAIPTTMPLHPSAAYSSPYPNATPYPALRAIPPSYSSTPYPTPHTPAISTTASPSAQTNLLLSQPSSYEDPTLSPTTAYFPAPDYLPAGGANPSPQGTGLHGDTSDLLYTDAPATTVAMLQHQHQQAPDHDPATDVYYTHAPATTMAMLRQQQQAPNCDPATDVYYADSPATTMAMLRQQQQAPDHNPATDVYYADSPATTMAMLQQRQAQATSDLASVPQYGDAITSLSLPAHIASTSGMQFPYVQ